MEPAPSLDWPSLVQHRRGGTHGSDAQRAGLGGFLRRGVTCDGLTSLGVLDTLCRSRVLCRRDPSVSAGVLITMQPEAPAGRFLEPGV
jgi:hypothetical protein